MKKKMSLSTFISSAVTILIGLAVGVMLGGYTARAAEAGGIGRALLVLAAALFCLVLAAVVQTVIHEAGHLIFGLISGYSFCSFRACGFVLTKNSEGRLSLKRLSVPGTLGQCIMSPPPVEEDRYMPSGLYNMGGAILNLVSAFVFFWLYLLVGGLFPSCLFMCLAALGIGFAAVNGLPLKNAGMPNDACNALSLGKSDAALLAFRRQLEISCASSEGLRLSQMEDSWFDMPAKEDMEHPLVVAQAVFRQQRMLDEHRFDSSKALAEELLSSDLPMPRIYHGLMTCDLISLRLIDEHGPLDVSSLLTDAQLKFMRSMAKYPSVLRTQYLLAVLKEQDHSKAQEMLSRFDLAAESYPWPADLAIDRELIELAQDIGQNYLRSDTVEEVLEELSES